MPQEPVTGIKLITPGTKNQLFTFDQTTSFEIRFNNETFHVELNQVEEIIKIRSIEGKIIISPEASNSIYIESDYYGE